MRIFVIIMLCTILITGCNLSKPSGTLSTKEFTTHNPTAEEMLSNNPDADIFQFNGIIYGNASNIEWVQEVMFTSSELIGSIKKQYSDGASFENEMATELPIGTEIYKPVRSQGILIVKVNDEEIRYLGYIEG